VLEIDAEPIATKMVKLNIKMRWQRAVEFLVKPAMDINQMLERIA
jgi:hypothetical protein